MMDWTRGETLGKGGFGFVSIAKTHGGGDLNIPAVVAVKSATISKSKSLSKEKELLQKFAACPCILRCFGDQITTENGENLYNIILEYAAGGCLADHIPAGKGLPENDVSRYAKSLITALIHIHKLGYVHCDVKPHNLLLVGEDSKLADFGSCKRVIGGSIEEEEDDLGFRGTILYAAPESIARGKYSSVSDIWGLGCTVLHMLTGESPWKFGEDATATDVLMKIACGDEIPAIPSGRKVSEAAKDFLRKCFVKDPAARLRAESLINHPFLKLGNHPFLKLGERRRQHHRRHLHLTSALHSLLPQCFHVNKIHAC